jgi:hypothetical protein
MKPAPGQTIPAEIEGDLDLVRIEAFLVEMAAWKGQSGSPVFLRPFANDDRTLDSSQYELSLLVGMIQGFYPGEQDVKINGSDATLSPLNMGIGIVVPSRDIRELLMDKGLKAKRESLLKARVATED